MTKLSKTYFGFRPGSSPAGRLPPGPPPPPALLPAALGRPPPAVAAAGRRASGPRRYARAQVEREDVGRLAVVDATPVTSTGPGFLDRIGDTGAPGGRAPVLGGAPIDRPRHGRPIDRSQLPHLGDGQPCQVAVRLAVPRWGPDGVGPDAEGAAPVVGPGAAGAGPPP